MAASIATTHASAIGKFQGPGFGTSQKATAKQVFVRNVLAPFPGIKSAIPSTGLSTRLRPNASARLPKSSIFAAPFVTDDASSISELKRGLGKVGFKGKGALSCEMDISVRIGRIMKSLVERAVSGNEDPELLLEQAAIEMSNDLVKLRKATAQVVATKSMLEQKYKRAKSVSDTWFNRARRALELGDENLARDILRRRKVYEKNANELKAQFDQQRMMASRIIECSKILEDKIAEARFKKNSLKGRAKAAKSAKYVSDLILSVDPSGALAAFDRMEEKIVRMEYETQAYTEIISDDLSLKFAKLGADVEDEFKKLKEDTFGPQLRGELPPLQR